MDLQVTTNNMDKIKEFVKDVKAFIVSNDLFVPIQGKNYVYVEGWQFMGGMLGIDAVPTTIMNVSIDGEIKYECAVELLKGDTVIGRGFAVCSNKEAKKRSFDEYAIASMAQTRAVGKAYRLKIGWMMKLAGYEGTPAEEAVGVEIDKKKEDAIVNHHVGNKS